MAAPTPFQGLDAEQWKGSGVGWSGGGCHASQPSSGLPEGIPSPSFFLRLLPGSPTPVPPRKAENGTVWRCPHEKQMGLVAVYGAEEAISRTEHDGISKKAWSNPLPPSSLRFSRGRKETSRKHQYLCAVAMRAKCWCGMSKSFLCWLEVGAPVPSRAPTAVETGFVRFSDGLPFFVGRPTGNGVDWFRQPLFRPRDGMERRGREGEVVSRRLRNLMTKQRLHTQPLPTQAIMSRQCDECECGRAWVVVMPL